MTHNFMQCIVKGCGGVDSFPLIIHPSQVEVDEDEQDMNDSEEEPLNVNVIRGLLERVDYKAFRKGALELGVDLGVELPEEAGEELMKNEEFLRKIYHLLVSIHIIEGTLECPKCSRKYKISQGIPNMLLREDEV